MLIDMGGGGFNKKFKINCDFCLTLYSSGLQKNGGTEIDICCVIYLKFERFIFIFRLIRIPFWLKFFYKYLTEDEGSLPKLCKFFDLFEFYYFLYF